MIDNMNLIILIFLSGYFDIIGIFILNKKPIKRDPLDFHLFLRIKARNYPHECTHVHVLIQPAVQLLFCQIIRVISILTCF